MKDGYTRFAYPEECEKYLLLLRAKKDGDVYTLGEEKFKIETELNNYICPIANIFEINKKTMGTKESLIDGRILFLEGLVAYLGIHSTVREIERLKLEMLKNTMEVFKQNQEMDLTPLLVKNSKGILRANEQFKIIKSKYGITLKENLDKFDEIINPSKALKDYDKFVAENIFNSTGKYSKNGYDNCLIFSWCKKGESDTLKFSVDKEKISYGYYPEDPENSIIHEKKSSREILYVGSKTLDLSLLYLSERTLRSSEYYEQFNDALEDFIARHSENNKVYRKQ